MAQARSGHRLWNIGDVDSSSGLGTAAVRTSVWTDWSVWIVGAARATVLQVTFTNARGHILHRAGIVAEQIGILIEAIQHKQVHLVIVIRVKAAVIARVIGAMVVWIGHHELPYMWGLRSSKCKEKKRKITNKENQKTCKNSQSIWQA